LVIQLFVLPLLFNKSVCMKTRVEFCPSNNKWNVMYSTNGITFKLHKSFKSIDDAIKETNIIKGGMRFLKDVLQDSK
jgi:hypothetical protein